ncbi:hypothetical protein NMY22_g1042 [Coprinellus aureogranulatus]|nr:hypothetical protein NMY22_g1042 [Coprinellus aureogranulatus]
MDDRKRGEEQCCRRLPHGDVRARGNLDIVLSTYATRVLPVGGSARKSLDIRTVELGSSTGSSSQTRTLTAKKELILTAGTIGTPHILLNSGIGDRAELAQVGVRVLHHSPNVGKGISDHVSVLLSWNRSVVDPPIDTAAALAEWQANRTGPLSEFGPTHQFLFKRFERSSGLFDEYPDPSAGHTSPHAEVVILPSGGNVNARIIVLTPRSRGSIKIRSSDPYDPPLVDTGFYTHPFDILAMTEAIRATKRFFSASPFTSSNSTSSGPYITGFMGPDPDLLPKAEFEAQLRNISAPYWHMVGSAAMSNSKEGVVDADLRVRGVKGLRVVDASVIVGNLFRFAVQSADEALGLAGCNDSGCFLDEATLSLSSLTFHAAHLAKEIPSERASNRLSVAGDPTGLPVGADPGLSPMCTTLRRPFSSIAGWQTHFARELWKFCTYNPFTIAF